MKSVEINFDGLIGPTHNYAGLSLGNRASATNAGGVSAPRTAALQGLMKMKRLMELGIPQGFLPPHLRPNVNALRQLGYAGTDEAICAAAWERDPALFRNLCSASPMWSANAATVSPAPDTLDGKVHLTVANLATMTHRSMESDETEHWLKLAFADERYFVVHPALPFGQHFGDEGAANHMRLAPSHSERGLEVFVYGEETGGRFPARQKRRASEAVSHLHGLNPNICLFEAQSDAAIQAGAFHNDVVAVANENVLFTHEQAFARSHDFYGDLRQRFADVVIIEVPASQVSLEDAIQSYLFNSQLLTLPTGSMALVLPQECQDNPRVWAYVQQLLGQSTPIKDVIVINVRESMRNGGGPACLRLRVQVSEEALAAIDSRFILTPAMWKTLYQIVETHWPESVTPDDLGDADFWRTAWSARRALLEAAKLA